MNAYSYDEKRQMISDDWVCGRISDIRAGEMLRTIDAQEAAYGQGLADEPSRHTASLTRSSLTPNEKDGR